MSQNRTTSTNLPNELSIKRNIEFPLYEKPLHELRKIPNKGQVIGRYLCLFKSEKCKKKRKNILKDELNILWSNLDFPSLSRQRIVTLINKLIFLYEQHRKNNKKYKFQAETLFDIIKLDGYWLSTEDRRFHKSQIES